jgi:hypothetical protein
MIKNKIGRPKTTKVYHTINFRAEADLYKRLKKWSKKRRCSLSAVIRAFCYDQIEQLEADE